MRMNFSSLQKVGDLESLMDYVFCGIQLVLLLSSAFSSSVESMTP